MTMTSELQVLLEDGMIQVLDMSDPQPTWETLNPNNCQIRATPPAPKKIKFEAWMYGGELRFFKVYPDRIRLGVHFPALDLECEEVK